MNKTQSKIGITITASPTCCCWTNIYYYSSEEYSVGAMKAYVTGCDDADLTWEILVGSTWTEILLSDPGFGLDPTIYDPNALGAQGPGLYRTKMSSVGCCDTYSNILESFGPV
jgi:hypothetical protein